MSGLVAVVAFGGAPVQPTLVDRMLEAQRHRGPDRIGVWMDGSAALGSCELVVTPEAARCVQPHASASGEMRVVLDGRIDNRGELTKALRADGRPPRDDTDPELLLASYEAWGDGFPARVLGDFAFAIWDGRRQALVCGRDPLGTRPLYLHRSPTFVAAASEIAPLLRCPSVSRKPNEGFIAEYLTGTIVHRTDTVWQDIERLEPAHVMVAQGGGCSIRRFWQIDPRREIRYGSDDEYAEHLADLIRQAVKVRLRSTGRVGVMLSGGIDSSSVVGAAHDVGGIDGSALPTFSTVGPGEPWDESEYIDAVAAKWPIDSVRVPAFRADRAHLCDQAAAFQDLPLYPNGEMANPLFSAAAGAGVRVLLTGSWSDFWFLGSTHYLADLVHSFRFGALWRHLAAQRDTAGAFRPSLFRSAVWPLVPHPARRAVKRLLGRDGIAPWVGRAFASRIDLAGRLRPEPPAIRFGSRATADLHTVAFSGVTTQGIEGHERGVSQFGLETRHPFGDRRIVEFGFAIPAEQRWRGAVTKVVLRKAAQPWLPALVRERLTYGAATDVLARAVSELVASGLWQNPVIERRGWVRMAPLRAAFDEMDRLFRSGDDRYEQLAVPLWLVCSVEIWGRRVLEETQDV